MPRIHNPARGESDPPAFCIRQISRYALLTAEQELELKNYLHPEPPA